jgi:hypothetical protein
MPGIGTGPPGAAQDGGWRGAAFIPNQRRDGSDQVSLAENCLRAWHSPDTRDRDRQRNLGRHRWSACLGRHLERRFSCVEQWHAAKGGEQYAVDYWGTVVLLDDHKTSHHELLFDTLNDGQPEQAIDSTWETREWVRRR